MICFILKKFTGKSGMIVASLIPWQRWSNMADSMLLRSLNSKSVNFSCKDLKKLPKIIGRLSRVVHIDLKGNRLSELPDEFGFLIQVHTMFSHVIYLFDFYIASDHRGCALWRRICRVLWALLVFSAICSSRVISWPECKPTLLVIVFIEFCILFAVVIRSAYFF